ncbi:MAG: PH domain-containing protein, partial [Pseudomonadota bacterium]|nr:PH domain-containing protein [Pseudomonadota bacterium]
EAVLVALPLLIGALVAEYLTPFPNFLIAGPVALILLLVVIMLPHRRYAVRGYALSDDRLRVVRGMMFHSDTVVPFGRVQHIDVDRGPIERYYGLATLQLYTAGSHGDVISLPGLAHQDALDMRETIRAHIKRASL